MLSVLLGVPQGPQGTQEEGWEADPMYRTRRSQLSWVQAYSSTFRDWAEHVYARSFLSPHPLGLYVISGPGTGASICS